MINKLTIQKYLWLPDHVRWTKPDPPGASIVYDRDEEVKKRLADPNLRPTDFSQRMQNIVRNYTLTQSIVAFRLCLFFNIKKGDMFEELEIVPTSISFPFLRRLITAWKESFPLLPEPMIARIFIPKGMHGFFPSQITKKNIRESEFFLGVNRIFYAYDDPYKEKIGKEKYQFVDFGVSFAVMEETYQKYKNVKHITSEQLIKYDEKMNQRKYN